MKVRLNLVLAILIVLVLAGVSRADDLTYWTDPVTGIVYEDPATLHIGSGVNVTTCPGSVFGCGSDPLWGDPNLLISNTHFSVYQTSNGGASNIHADSTTPFILILAVPNETVAQWWTPDNVPINTTCNAAKDNCLALYNPHDTTTPLGPGTVTNISFTPGFTSAFHGDIYSFLSLPGPTNNSNNWVNMIGGEEKYHLFSASDINSYGLYMFSLSFGSGAVLGPNGAIDINFTDQVPVGTYIFGYGTGPGVRPGTVKAFTTPFTESGLVPEPGSMILFGSGLLAAAGVIRRRLK